MAGFRPGLQLLVPLLVEVYRSSGSSLGDLRLLALTMLLAFDPLLLATPGLQQGCHVLPRPRRCGLAAQSETRLHDMAQERGLQVPV